MTKAQPQATFSPSKWLTGPVSQKATPKKRASPKKVTAMDVHSTTLTLEWEFMDHVKTMKRARDTVINLGGFMENFRQNFDRYEIEKKDGIDKVEKEIEELELLKHTNCGDLDEISRLNELIDEKRYLIKEKEDTLHILGEINQMIDQCYKWFDEEKEEMTEKIEKMKINAKAAEGKRKLIASDFDLSKD